MMEILDESEGRVVGIRGSGKLTLDDYERVLAPRLETMARKFGPERRALFYMESEFKGWELSAAWANTKLDLRHRCDLEKVAIVGAPAWEKWCVKLAAGALMKGELCTFDADQLPEAWEWVKS